MPVTPVGGVAATNVQAAIAELDTEKLTQAQGDARYVNITGDSMTGLLNLYGGGVPLGLTVAAPGTFVNMFYHVPQQNMAFGSGIMADGRYSIGTTDGNGQSFAAIWGVDGSGNVQGTGHITMVSDAGTDGKQVRFQAPGFGITGSIYGTHVSGNFTAVSIASQNQFFTFRNDGVGYATGGWQTGSDRRLKSNITPIPDALAKLDQISGNTFVRDDLDGRKLAGVIAQEIQAVLPEGVTVGETLSVDPMAVIALLVEAVKELSAKCAAAGI